MRGALVGEHALLQRHLRANDRLVAADAAAPPPHALRLQPVPVRLQSCAELVSKAPSLHPTQLYACMAQARYNGHVRARRLLI